MAVEVSGFFDYIADFIDYRKDIYLASDQTLKSNLIDLKLFENFIGSKSHKTINGPAVMEFQYHLKNDRDNCGGSITKVNTPSSCGGLARCRGFRAIHQTVRRQPVARIQ